MALGPKYMLHTYPAPEALYYLDTCLVWKVVQRFPLHIYIYNYIYIHILYRSMNPVGTGLAAGANTACKHITVPKDPMHAAKP